MTFNILNGAHVNFSVKTEKAGKRSAASASPARPRPRRSRAPARAAVPGDFELIGISGPNEFHFSGRIADKTLAPGSYRLVAKAQGTAGRTSYMRFKITK